MLCYFRRPQPLEKVVNGGGVSTAGSGGLKKKVGKVVFDGAEFGKRTRVVVSGTGSSRWSVIWHYITGL
jgi:hypothetical protein